MAMIRALAGGGGGSSNVEMGEFTMPLNNNTETITLGYKPKWVAIYYNNLPSFACGVASGESSTITCAKDSNGSAQPVVTITNTGFTVTAPYINATPWQAKKTVYVAVKS